jgi:membrane-bound serine protease (ClpP class)
MKLMRTCLRTLALALIVLGLAGSLISNAAVTIVAEPVRFQTSTPEPVDTPAPTNNASAPDDPVIVLTYSGIVTPVLDQYIGQGIQAAEEQGAQAVILQLDTPGGNINVTNSITQRMLGAPIPIVVYIAPPGARAGSAGAFITLAAHAAAMTPDSSIGAASPVDMGGGDIDPTMAAKIRNIMSADIETLADRRGEDAVNWAVAAVQDAAAATAAQALKLNVIDFIADDLDDLLNQLDGFQVTVRGEPRTLQTADAPVKPLELTPLQQFLNFISDPTVAAILLSLGALGLAVEMRAPGFGAAGIIGIISLLLGFYGLGQMDASFIGMALLGVGIILFIAEMFTPTFGALALGGAVAFILGSLLLFDTPGVGIPWPTLLVIVGLLAAFVIFAGSKALLAQRRQPLTGIEGMIGQTAKAKADFGAGETGSVFVHGEWWNAELKEGRVRQGDRVKVIGSDGYTLIVEAE